MYFSLLKGEFEEELSSEVVQQKKNLQRHGEELFNQINIGEKIKNGICVETPCVDRCIIFFCDGLM